MNHFELENKFCSIVDSYERKFKLNRILCSGKLSYVDKKVKEHLDKLIFFRDAFKNDEITED